MRVVAGLGQACRDTESLGDQLGYRGVQLCTTLVRQRDQHQHRELAAEPDHAARLDVAVEAEEDARHLLDDSDAIGAGQGEDDVGAHGPDLSWQARR